MPNYAPSAEPQLACLLNLLGLNIVQTHVDQTFKGSARDKQCLYSEGACQFFRTDPTWMLAHLKEQGINTCKSSVVQAGSVIGQGVVFASKGHLTLSVGRARSYGFFPNFNPEFVHGRSE